MADRFSESREENMSFNHISSYINSINDTRAAYLFFLSILNIAVYLWVYYLNDGILWEITGPKLLLVFMLILVNWVFSALVIREYHIKEASDRWLNKHLSEKGYESLADYKEYLRENDYIESGTWTMTKLLLALFNAVPITALVCLALFERFEESAMAVVFLSALFLITGISHIVLSLYAGEIDRRP